MNDHPASVHGLPIESSLVLTIYKTPDEARPLPDGASTRAAPLEPVNFRSDATLVGDGASDAERRLAVRYLGADRGMAYAARPRSREVIIRLEPGELRTWDFADYDW